MASLVSIETVISRKKKQKLKKVENIKWTVQNN